MDAFSSFGPNESLHSDQAKKQRLIVDRYYLVVVLHIFYVYVGLVWFYVLY